MADSDSLTLDIWAFVRLMVYLEEQETLSALFALWQEEWKEVDMTLAALAQTDGQAYSEMMMATQIALTLPGFHRQGVYEALQGLVGQLKAKQAAATDAQFRQDLDFEIQGLRALLPEGASLSQQGGRKRQS